MTNDELKALIESDADALALAKSGAADRCAERCRAIAPKQVSEARITELTVVSLYADPQDAEAVLSTVEAVAEDNPVVARMVKWLQPGAPGIDAGDPRVRAMLTTPVQQGGIGLTAEQAAPILQYAESEPQITGLQVSAAYPFVPSQE